MPANRKQTNKTAHVLNVITAGRETSDEASAVSAPFPAEPTAAPPPPPPPPVAAPLPTVVEVEHAPQELSDQIREALREELIREQGDESFSAFQPEVIKTGNISVPAAPVSPPSAPSPVPAAPVSPSPAPSPVPPVRQAPPPAAKPPASPPPTQQTAFAREEEHDESNYINVMQALVREKAPKYIDLLGVCHCSRCVADVEALALSHLDPKYIVLHKSQKFPYTVFENHYNAAVTSQIISACRTVMEKPRH